MAKVNKKWVLAERPVGKVNPQKVFRLETDPIPQATGEQNVVVRTLEVSLDPAMRGWIGAGKTYRDNVPIGGVMEGAVTGVVVQSNSPKFKAGDHVWGTWGWQEYAAVADKTLVKLPENFDTSLFLGAAGMTGFTAYFGLIDVGKPKAGETILVSGAAGATGSVVGQIAKLLGLRVVGTAGGEDKVAWLKSLGFDEAINYKGKNYKELHGAIKKACPKGIDIYFDNVGGDTFEIALDLINVHGRVCSCGMIAGYNAETATPGPRNMFTLITKRIRIEGFLVTDYQRRYEEARTQLLKWISEGKLQSRETIIEGFDKLPEALVLLFDGANTGKMVVRASKL